MTISEKPVPAKSTTPLWVISLFVSLTEVMTGIAATQTSGGIQVALTSFVIAFPVLIATAFFVILWCKPYVFYSPTEYQGTDVGAFVEAMQRRQPEALWLKIAAGETGVREIAGPEINPKIVEYFRTITSTSTDDEIPWSSSFVNWCIKQAGLQGTNSAAALSWLHWGRELSQPFQGCIVVMRDGNKPTQGYVGFYWGEEGERVLILGADKRNNVSVGAYPKAKVLSYRWPNELEA